MNKKNALTLAVTGALAALAAPAAHAIDFTRGELSGSFDTTISYGVSVRAEERDDDLVGKAQFDPTLAAQIAAL